MTRSKIKTLSYLAESSDQGTINRFFRLGLEHRKKLQRLLHLAPVESKQYRDIRSTLDELDSLMENTRQRRRPEGKVRRERDF